MKLPPLNLPPADLKVARRGEQVVIFDPLRDKYVAFTPEEYVRHRAATRWSIGLTGRC